MSAGYQGRKPIDIAYQAKKDLNSYSAKWDHDAGYDTYDEDASNSTSESDVDEPVKQKFPGADVPYGFAAIGAGTMADAEHCTVKGCTYEIASDCYRDKCRDHHASCTSCAQPGCNRCVSKGRCSKHKHSN